MYFMCKEKGVYVKLNLKTVLWIYSQAVVGNGPR